MKAAMKAKEIGKDKLTVIRMVRAAIKNVEIEQKRELTDDEIIQIIVREVKQRKDTIPEYTKANRIDIVEKLEKEITILQDYLPQQLTEAELTTIISQVIASTGANSSADMGKVMGSVMPKTAGRADGRLVNQIVKQLLS